MKLRKWAAMFMAVCLLLALAGCTAQQTEEVSRTEQPTTAFGMGERAPIMVPDENGEEQLAAYLTINSVRLTDERLSDEGGSAARVAVIRYTYDNVDIETGLMISSIQLRVTDGNGEACEGYPMVSPDYLPVTAGKGESHTAEQCYVLDEGDRLTVDYCHILTAEEPLLRFSCTVSNI